VDFPAAVFFSDLPVFGFLLPGIVDLPSRAAGVAFPIGVELFEKSQAGGADMGTRCDASWQLGAR
jgi:hypothetical protein